MAPSELDLNDEKYVKYIILLTYPYDSTQIN